MSDEVKSSFPVLTSIMSVSFHPPAVSVSPEKAMISLIFDDFKIELYNNENTSYSAYKNTTYSFTIDNPDQEASIIINYAIEKISSSTKAFITFLSNIECFTKEVAPPLGEEHIDDKIKIIIPKSSNKVYSCALSIFATQENNDYVKISIDSIDIGDLK